MPEIYSLALVITLASAFGILVRRYRQPLVVSYVVAGALLSAFHIVKPEELKFLAFLPEIGLAFLLFLVGMELDLREFKNLGVNIALAAVSQIVVSTILLFLLLIQFSLPITTSLLGALSISFSSTILVVKLLLEHKEISSLHGKLAIGILLLEDLIAVLVLMFLSIISNQNTLDVASIVLLLIKGGLLIWLSIFSGRRLLPEIFRLTAENTELLFMTAIAWCLLFVSFSFVLGFSAGIGAFLAGVSLAQSVYRIQISGRIKPLRDFFVMLFFIDLGTGLSISAVRSGIVVAVVLLLYTVVVKPLIFFLIFIALRFKARASFQTGILLSSISEFSLIILFLASRNALFGRELIAPVVFATVTSFLISSFLITHSHSIYIRLRVWLKKLERKNTLSFDFLPTEEGFKFSDHAVLVGAHRSGGIIIKALRKIFADNLVVADFNPDIIAQLKDIGVSCIYGDISDQEVEERLNLKEAKLIVSTVRDIADNYSLLDALEKVQSKAVVVMTANDAGEATSLYERGAHHVSIPLNLEGVNISHTLLAYQHALDKLALEREKKLGELKREAQS